MAKYRSSAQIGSAKWNDDLSEKIRKYGFFINNPSRVDLNTIPPDMLLWTDKKRPFFGKPLSFTRYSLFGDRFLVNRGFLTRHQEEMRLYRIKDVTLRQTFLQRIFRVGTVFITSTDASSARLVIQDVLEPDAVARLLSDCAEAEREKRGITAMECFDTLR